VKFRVIISRQASTDKDEGAASRVGQVLEKAIASLQELPERGRPVAPDSRELNATFGHRTYVIRYVVIDRQVIVTRIFHGRELR